MQNRDIYLMILGMTLVTYLPRVLPAFLMGRIRLNARVEHFLQLIPYTAMTALVFPGVFSVDANPVLPRVQIAKQGPVQRPVIIVGDDNMDGSLTGRLHRLEHRFNPLIGLHHLPPAAVILLFQPVDAVGNGVHVLKGVVRVVGQRHASGGHVLGGDGHLRHRHL